MNTRRSERNWTSERSNSTGKSRKARPAAGNASAPMLGDQAFGGTMQCARLSLDPTINAHWECHIFCVLETSESQYLMVLLRLAKGL